MRIRHLLVAILLATFSNGAIGHATLQSFSVTTQSSTSYVFIQTGQQGARQIGMGATWPVTIDQGLPPVTARFGCLELPGSLVRHALAHALRDSALRVPLDG